MTISILLVDDNAVFRKAVLSFLNSAGDFQVIGEAGDGLEALELAENLRPDVIVMDWAMPRLGGMETTFQLMKAFPQAHIIVLSMHSDHIHVQSAVQAGACGYVLKEDTVEHLAKAIHAAAAGLLYFSPMLKQPPDISQGENNLSEVKNEIS
jgi:two-component system, NarL family, response regulator NreC